MSDRSLRCQKWRALLTETLPYEVPIIFSNDLLFTSVASGDTDDKISAKVAQIRALRASGSRPYQYHIVKDDNRVTSLGIAHPIEQLRISEFYNSYAASITACCSRSEYSIRFPGEPTPIFTPNPLDPEPTLRLGIPHVTPEEGELDTSRLTSYFAYKGYPLLSKFIDSSEFLRLEKRFVYLRTLDISRCFFNIYTHSITWAVKTKAVAKRHHLLHSFDNSFDTLMQSVNYKETNGILIGPEVSRIFAEIILQAIDVDIFSELTRRNMEHNRHYAIRRYVDDYYIFSSSNEELDRIESVVEGALEKYKLFINTEKVETSSRPFVSEITLARRDSRVAIEELFHACADLENVIDLKELRALRRIIFGKIAELRMIAGQYGVAFNTLSGWLLGSVRVLVSRVTAASNADGRSSEQLSGIADVLIALIELSSYVAALDLRVRTTYSIAQLALTANRFGAKFGPTDAHDRVRHSIHQELNILIRAALIEFRIGNRTDSIELYNLLITSAYVLEKNILNDPLFADAIEEVCGRGDITYFQYITAKFCLLRDRPATTALLERVNSLALHRLGGKSQEDLGADAELYLLFCDLMSSPDLSMDERRQTVEDLFGGHLSNAQLERLGGHLRFVDWNGFHLEHLLERKQLRPVYSMS